MRLERPPAFPLLGCGDSQLQRFDPGNQRGFVHPSIIQFAAHPAGDSRQTQKHIMEKTNFIGFQGSAHGTFEFVNLDLVRTVTYGRENGKQFCTLIFGESHRVTLRGEAAAHLLDRVLPRARDLVTDEPLATMRPTEDA